MGEFSYHKNSFRSSFSLFVKSYDLNWTDSEVNEETSNVLDYEIGITMINQARVRRWRKKAIDTGCLAEIRSKSRLMG